jgi:Flp pilus assembly protein TadB
MPQGSHMIGDDKHNANNALGACLISAIFAVKVAVYENVTPSPATPYIFALLLASALASLVFYFRLKRRARREATMERPAPSRGGSNAV